MKPRSAALLLPLTLPGAAMLLVAPLAHCQIAPASRTRQPLRVSEKQNASEPLLQKETLQAKGKPQTALAKYGATIAIQPASLDKMWALIKRGDIYRDRKQWDAALADYNRASVIGDVIEKDVEQKQDASNAALRESKGNARELFEWREMSGKLELVENHATMGKARVLFLTDHPQAALAILNDLMPRIRTLRSLAFGSPPLDRPYGEPLDLWPELNGEVVRGTTLIALRRYREALVDLNEGLRHEARVSDSSASRYAELYFNRGRAYNGLGQKDKALADFDIAVKFDPAYKAPLKHTSYFKKLTPRAPGKEDVPRDLSETAAAYVLRGEEERNVSLDFSDAVSFYNDAIALDATFAPAYEGRAKAYATVANGNTNSKEYRSDVYQANAKARSQENEARAKADTSLTQVERDAKETERLAKVSAELKKWRNGAVSQKAITFANPKPEPIPAEKQAEYNAKALADFKQAIALEPNEPRWLESLIAFEKATPAYKGNVAGDETRLIALNKDLSSLATLTMFGGGADPEVILPLWKVKA